MPIPVKHNLDLEGKARIVGLQTAIADDEPATWGQLKAQLEGIQYKKSALAAATGNVNIASPGATFDGITATQSGTDRILLPNQTAPAENGIYIWNGAATPMTRASDANTTEELRSAYIIVDQGATYGDKAFIQTATVTTVGTTGVVFTPQGTGAAQATESAAGILEISTQAEANTGTDDSRALTPLKAKSATWMLKKFSATFGDGTQVQYDLTHGLGTEDVQVEIRKTAGNKERVLIEWRPLDANTVRVVASQAIAVNELRAVIIG